MDMNFKINELQYHEDEKAQRIIDCIPNDVTGFQVNINKIPKDQITAWHMHVENIDTFVVIQGSFKVGLVKELDIKYRIPYFDKNKTRGLRCNDIIVDDFSKMPVEWIILDAAHDSKKSLLIPPRIWHGVKAITNDAIILYYMKNGYDREDIQERPIGYFGETW